MDFKGKVALVTGAGNGIGRASAIGFARNGARVVLVDRDRDGGESTAGGIRQQGGEAIFVGADVTRSSDVAGYVRAALDAYGAIDCFHNNAGILGNVASIVDYDEAVFDSVIGVNLKGVFLGLKHVLPVMIQQRRGAVVNTASTAGLVGSPNMSAYVASKHGVIGLTKVAALEAGRHQVRVNAVCPGPVDTQMIHALEAVTNPDNPKAVGERYAASLPLGRYSTPEEIANMVQFLCSDLAANITGGHYLVDGGRLAAGAAPTATMRS
jgi:NAD(P)-dependent dehydrogenase (short-subunit alcohol dehydrogenase family)